MTRKTIATAALGVIVAAGGATLPQASAASYTPSSYDARLISLVNQARAQHGLSALTITSGTSTVATNWTNHLAAQNSLSHNPNLQSQLQSHGSPNWTIYGENVGEGSTSSPDQLFNAYMASPEHRANILESRYRYVGLGLVFARGYAWNTMDFVDSYNGAATTATTTHHATTSHTSATRVPVTSHSARPVAGRPLTFAVTKHTAPTRHATRRVAAPHVKALQSALPSPFAAPADTTPVPSTAKIISSVTRHAGRGLSSLAAALLLGLALAHVALLARRRVA